MYHDLRSLNELFILSQDSTRGSIGRLPMRAEILFLKDSEGVTHLLVKLNDIHFSRGLIALEVNKYYNMIRDVHDDAHHTLMWLPEVRFLAPRNSIYSSHDIQEKCLIYNGECCGKGHC